MPALPPISAVDFDGPGIRAYQLVLSAEAAALQEPRSSVKYNNNLIGVRVLGWFLKDTWDHRDTLTLAPFRRLVDETNSCCNAESAIRVITPEETKAEHEKVYSVGLMYRNNLMRAFRSNTGPLSTSSSHASRPSFDNHRENMLQAIAHASQTKADVKALALYRDGYKCMLTGDIDLTSYQKYTELMADMTEPNVILTECAHLFSKSAQDAGKDYGATALTILKLFGMTDVVGKILGGQVNSSLCNVLTLGMQFHTIFDRFGFWFEEVNGQPNTYNVVAHDPIIFRLSGSTRRRVTFQIDPKVVAECNQKGVPLPDLPDRRLIAIRAACARVAHASGAVEQIDQIIHDQEMIPVLAMDGSNVDLLNSLLTHSVSGVEVSG